MLSQIGKYRVGDKIGQGAMGDVYRALDPVLNRPVAIKTVAASLAPNDEFRARFLREAQSAAALNHPNIVTVYDFGEEQGLLYMAMELLEGKDLKDLIGTPACEALEDKLRIMEQICAGLGFAHSKGIVHRDLKPGNIHVRPDGHVKIMDFGVARVEASEITRTGVIMGTPHYMSPEQVRAERVDARSDIFSAGALCYELLTGRRPFQADSMPAVLFKVLDAQPEPIRLSFVDAPQALVTLVDRALAKDPAQRFQNASEMGAALRLVRQSLSGHEPTVATAVGTERVSGTRRLRVDGALALAPSPATSPPTLKRGLRAPPTMSPTAQATSAAPHPVGAPFLTGARVAVFAVLLAAGVGVAVWWKTHAGRSERGQAEVGALTQALAATQVQLAQKSLDEKDYRAAATQAEQVLKIDPGNGDAQRVLTKAQGALAALERATQEGRAALARGDSAAAGAALARILALDPTHPVAAELSAKLEHNFRAEAEGARSAMLRSRAAAEQARAQSLKPYIQGAALIQEAEALFGRQEYANATRRFVEARDAFDRAGQVAAERVTAPAPPSRAAAVSVPTPLPAPTAAPAPTPRPAVVAVTSTVAPAVSAPAPAPVNEEPAVRQVVENYRRAIERGDIGLYREVKPNLTKTEVGALDQAFRSIRSHQITLKAVGVRVEGNQATVTLAREDRVDGKTFDLRQTLVLVKGATGWTIQEIR